MKKYNQPNVIVEQVKFTSLMQGASPVNLNVGTNIEEGIGGA